MRRRQLISSWLPFWIAAACAGCDAGASPVALEDLRESAIEASCAFAFDCCSAAGREDRLPAGVTTEEECIANRTASDWDLEGEVRAAVDSGRYRYDADAAGDCLAALRSCEVENCFFTTGIVPDGSACEESRDCASQLCAEGTCTARRGAGEACVAAECGAGLVCVEGTCNPLLEDGAACIWWGECRTGFCTEAGVCGPRDLCL